MEAIRSFAVPNKPPGDKIGAVAAVRYYSGNNIPVSVLWRTNKGPVKSIQEVWEREGVFPVDIGDRKYHRRGMKSALEGLFHDLGVPITGSVAELADLINKNNQTGNLKGGKYPIFWILREAYKLGEDTIRVIDLASHVFTVWLEIRDKGLSLPSEPEFRGTECRELWKPVSCNTGPFTVGEYMLNMLAVGVDEPEIVERALYFVRIWDRARRRMKEAEQSWRQKKHRFGMFATNLPGKSGVEVETEDQFLGRAGFKAMPWLAIVMVRNARGNVQILSRGVSLGTVGRILKRREEDLWYCDGRLVSCMNGTIQYDLVDPTQISKPELRSLVANNLRHAEGRPR